MYRNHPYNRSLKNLQQRTQLLKNTINLTAESVLGTNLKVIDSMIVLQSNRKRKMKLLEIMIHI